MKHNKRPTATVPVVLGVAVLLALIAAPAAAGIDGIEVVGSIDLYARADYVTSADGASILIWGLTDSATGRAQYPAPTLIINQGDEITINLHNDLARSTSLIFPGHDVAGGGSCASESFCSFGLNSCMDDTGCVLQDTCVADTCTLGLNPCVSDTDCSAEDLCEAVPAVPGPFDMTCQIAAGATGSYTFTAENAGTYLYHSGTNPALQSEMGLFGAIVVRPFGYDELNPTAYGHPDTAFDREYLFVLSEMDSRIHQAVEYNDTFAGTEFLGDYFANYWFINGRTAPDTLSGPGVPWLPTQPYNSLPQMLPGERLLMRVVSAGRDPHPFHHHGNHAVIIGHNGRMPESAPGQGPDLGYEVFTMQSVPGETFDAIFTWTGENMGWDIYGTPAEGMDHSCVDGDLDDFDDVTHEYCPDHYKPIPVTLPENLDLAFGGFWSGSPYMGAAGALPPGEGGLNPNAGYTFMWHSHTEKELTNNDIFPGGMLTMLIVNPPGTVIE